MLLAEVVAASAAVAAMASRNTKVAVIATLLQRATEEYVESAHLAGTEVAATSGTGATGATDATDATGPSDPSDHADADADADELALVVHYLSGTLRQRRTGIQLTASTRLPDGAAAVPRVTVSGFDAALQRVSRLGGPGSAGRRAELFADLVAALTTEELSFVYALLRGGIRQGALESVVLTAVARASGTDLETLRRAVTMNGSLPAVASVVLRDGPEAAERFRLTVGRGISPMLASSAPTVREALQRTGPAGVEWKLDGIRAQIHLDGDSVRVFTRSLEDITDRVPEVTEELRRLDVRSAVFDGELIALHDDGRPRPFQQTGSRTASRVAPDVGRGKLPLTAFLFDVLHLDGADLVDEAGPSRRAALELAVPPDMHGLLTPRLVVDDPADATQVRAAEDFAADAVARGHEGVVVKAHAAPYQMGRRGAGWVKVKPVHTLDLVLLGVERGNGRRAGWLSNLHLGARDPEGRFGPPGGFVMLGKTFKGLTDEMLRWQTVHLPDHADGPTDGYVVRLRPEVVVEIAFDGVQTSPRYPSGLALRFARVVRHRPDKSADEADVIAEVEALVPDRAAAGLDAGHEAEAPEPP